ncbi:NTP transferase domain-containing protein [Candidatus Micrarchaeota archaeon]|nr:NTP transferase domain-containing protein [Candidatus Micrarchaeota archaeon]
MKTRLSVSIDSRLASRLDSASAGGSRSAVVERALGAFLSANATGVILAGGPARNLFVGEVGQYRPLVQIGKEDGKETPVQNILGRFAQAGIGRALVVGSREVNAAIFSRLGGGPVSGVSLEFIEEKEHGGSLHTLSLALPRAGSEFAFAACDHYLGFSLRELREFHERAGNPLTLGVYAGTAFEWSKTSVVRMQGSIIEKYWERPQKPESHIVSTMAGFANADAFYGMKMEGSIEAAFEKLAGRGMLHGFIVQGDFVNIHSRRDAETAGRLLHRQPLDFGH